MKIIPLADRVVIKTVEVEETTKGGLILTGSAKEKPQVAQVVAVTPIQTGFKFERVNNWGGFINRKVFFVHFTKDFELIKLDFE